MTKNSRFNHAVRLAGASVAITLGMAACNNNNPAPTPAPDNGAQTQAAQPDQINVVLNWFEELSKTLWSSKGLCLPGTVRS